MPLALDNLPESLRGCEAVLAKQPRYLQLLDPEHPAYHAGYLPIVRAKAGLDPPLEPPKPVPLPAAVAVPYRDVQMPAANAPVTIEAAMLLRIEQCPQRTRTCQCPAGQAQCALGKGSNGLVVLQHCADCLIEQDQQAYPSGWQQAKNAGEALVRFLRSGLATAPRAVVDERRALCNSCDRRDVEQDRCRECGCYLKIKTRSAVEFCPIGKWGEAIH